MVEETIKPAKRTLAQIAADMTAKKGLKDSEFPVQEQPKPENLTFSQDLMAKVAPQGDVHPRLVTVAAQFDVRCRSA